MAWKSLEELTAKISDFDSSIEDISDTFEVVDDYLISTMTAAGFVEGYKKHRKFDKTNQH